MLFNNIDRRSQLSKLPKNFWPTLKDSDLSMEDKIVLAYLYTSPPANRLGYFQCSPSAIASALEMEIDNVYLSLFSLRNHNLLKFGLRQNVIYIPHYLDQFPIKNRNQGKYIQRIFNNILIFFIPNDAQLLLDLIRNLLKVGHLSPLFRKSLKKLFYGIQIVMTEGEKYE
jgi:hypothetical protein